MSLNLNKIASRLRSLEEEIIYKLINRIQYKSNLSIYKEGKSGFTPFEEGSLFDLRIQYQEEMDSLFGRFLVPEERPVNTSLPRSRRVFEKDERIKLTDVNAVNLSNEIKGIYIDNIVNICDPGDDGHYGSSVEHDVAAFQAITRRIHYGALYVAESKFLQDPERYSRLIMAGDEEQLMALLTRKEVEMEILQRIEDKAREIQKDVDLDLRKVFPPDKLRKLYEDTIIPLTKKGEIAYFKQRPL